MALAANFRGKAVGTRPPEDQSQGFRHDRTENTGNCSQLPVTPCFSSKRRWRSGHGSNAGHSSGVAGVDARRATPPDPRLARWGLAGGRQLDPSHPALVTREDPGVEPCPELLPNSTVSATPSRCGATATF